MGGPVAQPALERVQRLHIARRADLDAAVDAIDRAAAQAQGQRALPGGGAEEHALHPAADDEAGRAHAPGAASPGCTGAPGAGPPAAAIASSIWCAVTGPRNCFATVPSGATR
jgi:hypothetical protein